MTKGVFPYQSSNYQLRGNLIQAKLEENDEQMKNNEKFLKNKSGAISKIFNSLKIY